MTSRQSGQKINQLYGNRTGYRTKRRKTSQPLSAAEKRRLVQFLVCGTVFVLLVAVKLLLPARSQWLSRHVGGALSRSVDVTEVFSAVGRVFAGNAAEGWEDLYQSVFRPETDDAIPAGAVGTPTDGAAEDDPADSPAASAAGASLIHSRLSASDGWLTSPPMENTPKSSPVAENPSTASTSPGETSAKADANPQQTIAGTQRLSYVLYSNQTLPDNVSLEQKVLGFDYCTPVMGTLSSDFGYREHPIEGDEKFHYGLDIAADEGTPVSAFADGTVTAVGESSSYGKYAIVSHDGGFSTLYAHCSRIYTSSGAQVKEGDKIAAVGQTGEATGPHLHFELHSGTTYLDPIYYVSLP